MVTLAKYALIAMAIVLSPFYLALVFGGMIADRRAQRRHTAMLRTR